MTKPFKPIKWFEIGDLVSAFPGTPPHNMLMTDGCTDCVPIGIILAEPEEGSSGPLWGRYDVQWFSPKKIKTERVRSFYLEKVLENTRK